MIVAIIIVNIWKKQILSLNLFYITNCKLCSLNCLVGSETVFLTIKYKFSYFNSDLVIKWTECHYFFLVFLFCLLVFLYWFPNWPLRCSVSMQIKNEIAVIIILTTNHHSSVNTVTTSQHGQSGGRRFCLLHTRPDCPWAHKAFQKMSIGGKVVRACSYPLIWIKCWG